MIVSGKDSVWLRVTGNGKILRVRARNGGGGAQLAEIVGVGLTSVMIKPQWWKDRH